MPSDGQLVASSIEEMLVSLAGGIREAQEALNELPALDSFGRQAPGYFIPHLDFEFDVEIITESNSEGRPIMKIGQKTSSSSNSTTSSKITGRLVAIPPGEGLPTPVLTLAIEQQQANKVQVVVRAANSAGEVMNGYQVELNIDEEASRAVSTGNVSTLPATKLEQAVLTTDAAGEARTTLTITSGGGSGKLLLLVAQLGSATAKLLVNTAGGS